MDTEKDYSEEELSTMLRQDLFALAKAKAKKQDKVISFGSKKNSDLIDLILGKQPFTEKADKLRQTPERVPLSGMRQKLLVPEHLKESGYHEHIINDYGSRIEEALQGGYEFIVDFDKNPDVNMDDRRQAMGAALKFHVGPNRDGQPMTGYAMRIRQEFYDEDQKVKQDALDEIEKAIKGGETGNMEGRYIPQPGIKIRDNY